MILVVIIFCFTNLKIDFYVTIFNLVHNFQVNKLTALNFCFSLPCCFSSILCYEKTNKLGNQILIRYHSSKFLTSVFCFCYLSFMHSVHSTYVSALCLNLRTSNYLHSTDHSWKREHLYIDWFVVNESFFFSLFHNVVHGISLQHKLLFVVRKLI